MANTGWKVEEADGWKGKRVKDQKMRRGKREISGWRWAEMGGERVSDGGKMKVAGRVVKGSYSREFFFLL